MADKANGQRNSFEKNTYRVINEPFKLFGILDWRAAAMAAVPAVFCGLLTHSKITGAIIFAVLAWRAWQISEDDPNVPLAWWVTLFDKRHASGFSLERNRKEK